MKDQIQMQVLGIVHVVLQLEMQVIFFENMCYELPGKLLGNTLDESLMHGHPPVKQFTLATKRQLYTHLTYGSVSPVY